MATGKGSARKPPTAPGTYFLSLTVENVRCFGPAQTLDLSDGHGRHAPWTIILGENGHGKTTLLTCLTMIATAPRFFGLGQGLQWYGTLLSLNRNARNVRGIIKTVAVGANGSRTIILNSAVGRVWGRRDGGCSTSAFRPERAAGGPGA
jgi:energy-coupling factor transporter ATP-binding protein EcfA2